MSKLIAGIFTCGCGFDATLKPVELVSCDDSEVPLVEEKMRQHAAEPQCKPQGAVHVFEVLSVPVVGELVRFGSYREFREAWSAVGAELGIQEIRGTILEPGEFKK